MTEYGGYNPNEYNGETLAQLADLEAQGFPVPEKRLLEAYDADQAAAAAAAHAVARDAAIASEREAAVARVADGTAFTGASDAGVDSYYRPEQ